jgi:hypothetical protein
MCFDTTSHKVSFGYLLHADIYFPLYRHSVELIKEDAQLLTNPVWNSFLIQSMLREKQFNQKYLLLLFWTQQRNKFNIKPAFPLCSQASA